MADLKAGTTVGGTLVWTQGNFPLFPTGDTLLYKTFKVYTENNKPLAIDNDFVSKTGGGTYLKGIAATGNLQVISDGSTGIGLSLFGTNVLQGEPTFGMFFGDTSIFGTHGASQDAKSVYFTNKGSANHGWIFKTSVGAVASIGANGTFTSPIVISTTAPTDVSHLTRKDYVDSSVNSVKLNADSRVLRSGDTMTGILTVPSLITTNIATNQNQVPQLGQVIQKGIILDYGTF